MTDHAISFPAALHATAPAPDRADPLQLYGQFIGDWDAEIVAHTPDGKLHRAPGEIHFGWILQGRAVQDVWMIPPPPFPIAGNWYGSTVRSYDPTIDAWRIFWIDPATNNYRQQIGRARGADIVQEGVTESSVSTRWSFTKITPESFHWLGEAKQHGAEWVLLVEVIARRKR